MLPWWVSLKIDRSPPRLRPCPALSYWRMTERKLPKVYEFEGGEVAVWYDGCVCIKAISPAPHNDPVEMRDEEAVALAETLLRLVRENG